MNHNMILASHKKKNNDAPYWTFLIQASKMIKLLIMVRIDFLG